ncbi:hypothetical protein JMUB7538_27350 [Staphylococcus aureus]
MIRRPPRSTRKESSAASDVYKITKQGGIYNECNSKQYITKKDLSLSLIHI